MGLKRIQPSESLNLSYEEFQFFYKNLLRCESNKGNMKGYKFRNKKLQKYIKRNNLTITYIKRGNITENSKYNEVKFIDNYESVCVSLFFHLRNAFAHGYIKENPKTGIFHLQDYKGVNCVMDGKMTFDNLKNLIMYMLNTKKQQ